MREDVPREAPHLGGHGFVTHLDRGILEFCKTGLHCNSFLDIGCGPGGMLQLAKEVGYDPVLGIDGDPSLESEDIYTHDFTTGLFKPSSIFDLGYSCEFVEHVEQKYIQNFIPAFQSCEHLLITYAPPGTPGHHHVNCNTKDYWISTLENYGFLWAEELTKVVRSSSTMKRNFVRQNGLFFFNENL